MTDGIYLIYIATPHYIEDPYAIKRLYCPGAAISIIEDEMYYGYPEPILLVIE